MFVLSVILFLSFFPLHADIFSLWPFRGNSSASAKGDSVTDILEPQKEQFKADMERLSPTLSGTLESIWRMFGLDGILPTIPKATEEDAVTGK